MRIGETFMAIAGEPGTARPQEAGGDPDAFRNALRDDKKGLAEEKKSATGKVTMDAESEDTAEADDSDLTDGDTEGFDDPLFQSKDPKIRGYGAFEIRFRSDAPGAQEAAQADDIDIPLPPEFRADAGEEEQVSEPAKYVAAYASLASTARATSLSYAGGAERETPPTAKGANTAAMRLLGVAERSAIATANSQPLQYIDSEEPTLDGIIAAISGKDASRRTVTFPENRVTPDLFGLKDLGNNQNIVAAELKPVPRYEQPFYDLSQRINSQLTTELSTYLRSHIQLSTTSPQPNLSLEILRSNIQGTLQVRLEPVELGKVRILFNAAEGGIQISFIVERSETLDLMKRYSQSVIKDLNDMGLENFSLAFSKEEGGEGYHNRSDSAQENSDTLQTTGDVNRQSSNTVTVLNTTNHVDIRI